MSTMNGVKEGESPPRAMPRTQQRRVFQGGASIRAMFQRERVDGGAGGGASQQAGLSEIPHSPSSMVLLSSLSPSSPLSGGGGRVTFAHHQHHSSPIPNSSNSHNKNGRPIITPSPPPLSHHHHHHGATTPPSTTATKALTHQSDGARTPPRSAPTTTTTTSTISSKRRGDHVPSGLHVNLASSNPIPGYLQLAQDSRMDEKTAAVARSAEEGDRIQRHQLQLPVYSPRTMPHIIPLSAFVEVYSRPSAKEEGSSSSPRGGGGGDGDGKDTVCQQQGSMSPKARNTAAGMGASSTHFTSTVRSLGTTHENILRKSPYELTLRDLDNVDVVSDEEEDDDDLSSNVATELDYGDSGGGGDAPISSTTHLSTNPSSMIASPSGSKRRFAEETSTQQYRMYLEAMAAAAGRNINVGESELDKEMRLFERFANDEAFEEWLGLGQTRSFGAVLEAIEEKRAEMARNADREIDAKESRQERAKRKQDRQKKKQMLLLGNGEDSLSKYYNTISKSIKGSSPTRRHVGGGGNRNGKAVASHSGSLVASLSMSQRTLFSQAGVLQVRGNTISPKGGSEGEGEAASNGDVEDDDIDADLISTSSTSSSDGDDTLASNHGGGGGSSTTLALSRTMTDSIVRDPSTASTVHHSHADFAGGKGSIMAHRSTSLNTVATLPRISSEEKRLLSRLSEVRQVVSRMGFSIEDTTSSPLGAVVVSSESGNLKRRLKQRQHPRRRNCISRAPTHVDPAPPTYSVAAVAEIASGTFKFNIAKSATEVPGGCETDDRVVSVKDVIPGYDGIGDEGGDDHPPAHNLLESSYPPLLLPLLADFRKWVVSEMTDDSAQLDNRRQLSLSASPGVVDRTPSTVSATLSTANNNDIIPQLGEGEEPSLAKPLTQFLPAHRLPITGSNNRRHHPRRLSPSSVISNDKKLSDFLRCDIFHHLSRAVEFMDSFCVPLTFEEFLRDAQACVDGVDADGFDLTANRLSGVSGGNTDRLHLAAVGSDGHSCVEASVWVKGPILQRVPYGDRHNPNAAKERRKLEHRARAAGVEVTALAVKESMAKRVAEHSRSLVYRHDHPEDDDDDEDEEAPSGSVDGGDEDGYAAEDTVGGEEGVESVFREMAGHVVTPATPKEGQTHPSPTALTSNNGATTSSSTVARGGVSIRLPSFASIPQRPPLVATKDEAVLHYDLDYREPVFGGGWLTGTSSILEHVKKHLLLTAHVLVSVAGEVERFLDALAVFVNSQKAVDAEDAMVRDGLLGGCLQLKNFITEFNGTVVKMETRVLEYEEFEGVRGAVEGLTNSKVSPIEQVLEWMLSHIPFPHQRDAVMSVTSITQLEELINSSTNNDGGGADGELLGVGGMSLRGSPRSFRRTSDQAPFQPNSMTVPEGIRQHMITMFGGGTKPSKTTSSPIDAPARTIGPAEAYASDEGLLATTTIASSSSSVQQGTPGAEGTQSITDHIASTTGLLTNLLTEVAATASPLLGLHRSWKEALLDGVYQRLAQINHIQETLSYGFIDPILTKRLYDTDPNSTSNASNKFVQRAVARRRRNSLEQYMYERGTDNLELLIERFATGDTWMLRHQQERADQLDEGSPINNNNSSPLRRSTAFSSPTARRNTDTAATTDPTSPNSPPRRRQLGQPPSVMSDRHDPPPQQNPVVTLNSVSVAQFVKRLMCEYRCIPEQVATKVKNNPSVSVGIQLCLSSRYLLGELGPEFDEVWGMSWVLPTAATSADI